MKNCRLFVGVDSNAYWPDRFMIFNYGRYAFEIHPITETAAPCISIQIGEDDFEDVIRTIRNFMSAVCWIYRTPVRELLIVGNARCGRDEKCVESNYKNFNFEFIPYVTDAKASLALAFFREGTTLNNKSYKFLSFFKILNILFPDGPSQKRWINNNLNNIASMSQFAQRRITDLSQTQQDIGAYLWESGRCAIAHAFNHPLINPDSYQDTSRLEADLDVAEAIAEYIIESEFGIKSLNQIHKEHLYEVQGFLDSIGEKQIDSIKQNSTISPSDVKLPRIHLKIRHSIDLPFFKNMKPVIKCIQNGKIEVHCYLDDPYSQDCYISFTIDIHKNSLIFDPFNDIKVINNGTKNYNLQIGITDIYLECLKNCLFELWSDSKILSRMSPYIPSNIDPEKSYNNLVAHRQTLSLLDQIHGSKKPLSATESQD